MSLPKPRAAEDLSVQIPSAQNVVIRSTRFYSPEEREAMQKATEYNVFAFPSSMLVVDYLSDSGTSAMFDTQWASLIRGDEAYGRNHGYFAIMQAVRNTMELGDNPIHPPLDGLITSGLCEPFFVPETMEHEGGFANGGRFQLERPNFFLVPQGRCAENLFFSTVREHMVKKVGENGRVVIPSNGFFDTTEAQAHVNKLEPVNLFAPHLHDDYDVKNIDKVNPFKGNIDLDRLEKLIEDVGVDHIPLILLTITNNTAAGQPVSMLNIRETARIAEKYSIPLVFDAARFAENAWFIKEFENGYAEKSVPAIVQEMFSYVSAFMISLKKDGLCNIGGLLCLRDKGLFHQKFSTPGHDIGISIKEKQILNYGNDSYGGMSGRDVMAAATGLRMVVEWPYLNRRIKQVRKLALGLHDAGIPLLMPPGGHAIYIECDKFFHDVTMKMDDFGGVGLTMELIRLYGIRACELGPYAFEWDQKTPEQRKAILNLVRLAVPRNVYNEEHINYTIAAVGELYRCRHQIPKIRIVRGAKLHLRHFQSALSLLPGDWGKK